MTRADAMAELQRRIAKLLERRAGELLRRSDALLKGAAHQAKGEC